MQYSQILERAHELGLRDDRYRFCFGPEGLAVSLEEIAELGAIGRAAMDFLHKADDWYRNEAQRHGGSPWAAILQTGIPSSYVPLTLCAGIPHTVMIDTVYTNEGWRVVEIDATNRNALGYPPALRKMYELPSIWLGADKSWRAAGWEGALHLMAHRCRFYEPYYRYFQSLLGGSLVSEERLASSLEALEGTAKLVDLPIMSEKHLMSGEQLRRLLELAGSRPMAIPPKHHLSNKGLLTLPWEINQFAECDIRRFLPESHLLRAESTPPDYDFFVKMIQSGGAKGTFHGDLEQFARAKSKRPRAIVQRALPIKKRPVQVLQTDNRLVTEDRFVRVSIFVEASGQIVDADVTASHDPIVHGGINCVMTVPVLR